MLKYLYAPLENQRLITQLSLLRQEIYVQLQNVGLAKQNRVVVVKPNYQLYKQCHQFDTVMCDVVLLMFDKMPNNPKRPVLLDFLNKPENPSDIIDLNFQTEIQIFARILLYVQWHKQRN